MLPPIVHGRPVRTGRARTRRGPLIGLLTATLLAVLVTSGCGSDTATNGTSAGSSLTAVEPPVPADAGNGEAGGAEAPAVPFESPTFHYRVDAPGAMTAGADGTASAHSGAERLSIAIVTGNSASDATALARTDMNKDREMTGFRLKSGPVVTPLEASTATVKASFAATEGTSDVTGKANTVVVVKYWVPKDTSTLAVLTYTVTESQYDAQGADDVANTFRWL